MTKFVTFVFLIENMWAIFEPNCMCVQANCESAQQLCSFYAHLNALWILCSRLHECMHAVQCFEAPQVPMPNSFEDEGGCPESLAVCLLEWWVSYRDGLSICQNGTGGTSDCGQDYVGQMAAEHALSVFALQRGCVSLVAIHLFGDITTVYLYTCCWFSKYVQQCEIQMYMCIVTGLILKLLVFALIHIYMYVYMSQLVMLSPTCPSKRN